MQTDTPSIAPLLVDEPTARRLLGGLCAKSMYNLRQQGLPYCKIGSRILYSPDDLSRWIEAQKHVAQEVEVGK